LVSPGLPDIKWNELYYKWGHFVPQEKKNGLKYFVEKPPTSFKKAIAEQSAAAETSRAKGARGKDDHDVATKLPAAKNTMAAKKKT
jgi:hypothetical protein